MRYRIKGFTSASQLAEFGQLIEFACNGRVLVGWEEVGYEDGWPVVAPVYDDTDRSDHELYPLAYALSLCFAPTIVSDDNINDVIVSVEYAQPEIMADAAAQAAQHGLTVRADD